MPVRRQTTLGAAAQILVLAKVFGVRLLLVAGIAAAMVLTVAIISLGYLEPEYSHVSQFVSELGAVGAANQKMFNYGGLAPVGLLTAVFSLGLYSRLRPGASIAASSALVALTGIASLTGAFFPCDRGCSIEDMSMSAIIHAQAGFIATVSGVLAPIVLAYGLRERRQNILFKVSLGLGSASLLLVVLFSLLGPHTPYLGAIQRLALAAFYGWVISIAVPSRAVRR